MRLLLSIVSKKSIIAMLGITIVCTGGIPAKALEHQSYSFQAQLRREPANITANVDNVTPSQNTTINVIVTGPVGAAVKVVCHYKTTDVTYSGVIGVNGKAIIPVNVGVAEPKYQVFVDVYVTSDRIYTTETMFIPQ